MRRGKEIYGLKGGPINKKTETLRIISWPPQEHSRSTEKEGLKNQHLKILRSGRMKSKNAWVKVEYTIG